MSTSRVVLRGVLVTLLVWAASVPLAEYAFLLAGTRVAGVMDGFYLPFAEKSYRPRENAEAFMNWFSGGFHVYTDDLGLRVGSDRAASHDRGAVDILVMGDSQAFGQGLDYEQTVVGRFAALAAAK